MCHRDVGSAGSIDINAAHKRGLDTAPYKSLIHDAYVISFRTGWMMTQLCVTPLCGCIIHLEHSQETGCRSELTMALNSACPPGPVHILPGLNLNMFIGWYYGKGWTQGIVDAGKFSTTMLMPFLNTNEFHVCSWVPSPRVFHYTYAKTFQVLKKERAQNISQPVYRHRFLYIHNIRVWNLEMVLWEVRLCGTIHFQSSWEALVFITLK